MENENFENTIKQFSGKNGFKGYWILFFSEYENNLITLCREPDDVQYNLEMGHGMYSQAFYDLKVTNKDHIYVKNTYNDPRGVFTIGDLKIVQEKSLMLPFYDDNDDNKKTLKGLVAFFGNENIEENKIADCKEFVALHNEIICIKSNQKAHELLLIPSESKYIKEFKKGLEQAKFSYLKLVNIISGGYPLVYIKENGIISSPNDIVINYKTLQRLGFELIFQSFYNGEDRYPEDSPFKYFSDLDFKKIEKNLIIKPKNGDGNTAKEVKLEVYFLSDSEQDVWNKIFNEKEIISSHENVFDKNSIAYHKMENDIVTQEIKNKIKKLDKKEYIYYTIKTSFLLKKIKSFSLIPNYYLPSNYLPFYYDSPNCIIDKNFNYKFEKIEDVDNKFIIDVSWNKAVAYKWVKSILYNYPHLIDKIFEYFMISNSVTDLEKPISNDTNDDIAPNNTIKVLGIAKIEENQNKIAKALYSSYKSNYLIALNKHLLELEATRSAISQVIARNMSHNIGSHVLSKLIKDDQIRKIHFKNKEKNKKVDFKNDSISKKNILFYQCLTALNDIDIKDLNKDKKILDKDEKILDKDKETNYSLLATFFNYLKIRMDFLADITTSTPVMENTKCLYNDVIRPFIQNRVLNDRISGIDNFWYEIIVCKPDSEKNTKICKKTSTKDCLCKLHDTTDIQVAIPNDILGVHAIYTILENIIRNSAKHGDFTNNSNKKVEEDPVEFKIKVEEASNSEKEFIGVDLDQYYVISIFDNCEYTTDKINKLVIKQNESLNKDILVNNQLRHGGWGLIEMEASAAYLRKIPVELIDSDEYHIRDSSGKNTISKGNKLCIFQAYAEQDKYLGYRFFVYKPREILVIGVENHLLKFNSEEEKTLQILNLKKEGIWIKSKDEIEKALKNNTVFPHRLVVIADDKNNEEIENLINQNSSSFSKRIVKFKFSKNEIIDNQLKLWKSFYEQKKYKKYGSEFFATDDHGKSYCTFDNNKNFKFIEITNSATEHFHISFSNIPNNKLLKEENLNFSMPLEIVVIDERIQYFAMNVKYPLLKNDNCPPINIVGEFKCYHKDGLPYSNLYKKTNILVPHEKADCNLNKQNFYEDNDSEYDKIIGYIKTNFIDKINSKCGHSIEKTEFIVIHLGIIEKLIAAYNKSRIDKNTYDYDKEDPVNVGNFIKNQIGLKDDAKVDKNLYDKVIITSGRGKPHNLPEDVRYINFSVISQYMITQRNKFAFTEALYSARKYF